MQQKIIPLVIVTLAVTIFTGCKKDLEIYESGNLVPKTVAEDPTIPAISVNGTRLHAETFGNPNDPMVVFLHGGPGGDYRNGLKAKQLADDGYYVVFYDQRGSGLSTRYDKSHYSIQVMLDDLTAVIDHYRTSSAQKVFLFGHSWGGMLAAGYINAYPDRIDGAIFAEATGITKEMLDQYGEDSRRVEIFKEHLSDVLYMDQFLTGKATDHNVLDYKLNISSSYTYAPGNAEGIEGASPFWRNGAVVLNALAEIAEKDGYDFSSNLHLYTTKVLFIYGENNTAYGAVYAQKEADLFPDAQVSQIDDTGHEMIYFKWENVYPVVLTYLNSLN